MIFFSLNGMYHLGKLSPILLQMEIISEKFMAFVIWFLNILVENKETFTKSGFVPKTSCSTCRLSTN